MESVFSDVKHHVSWLDLLKSIYIFTLVYTELLEISIQNQAMGSTETTRPLVQNREGKAGFGWWMLGETNKKKNGETVKNNIIETWERSIDSIDPTTVETYFGKTYVFLQALLVLCDPTYCGKCLEQAASAEGTRGVWQRTRCKKHIVEISPLFILGQAWMGRS